MPVSAIGLGMSHGFTMFSKKPDYLASELHVYQPQRCLRSLSQELLTVPYCKTMLGKHRFSVAAPSVWNSLPLNLRMDYSSFRGFKTNLKTHLFRQDLAIVTQRLRLQL